MLGQLHDAGNTTTLAHYLELLAGAGRSGPAQVLGQRGPPPGVEPKLQVLNTALSTAQSGRVADTRADGEAWGRLVDRRSVHTWPTPRRPASSSCRGGATGTARSTSCCQEPAASPRSRSRAGGPPSQPGIAAFTTAFAGLGPSGRCWSAATGLGSSGSCSSRGALGRTLADPKTCGPCEPAAATRPGQRGRCRRICDNDTDALCGCPQSSRTTTSQR